MSVYVDDSRARFGRMVMCHMMADSPDELHGMAVAIGVARQWFQGPPKHFYPHYDIALSKRVLAVRRGAKEVTARELIGLFRAPKEGDQSTARVPRVEAADDR